MILYSGKKITIVKSIATKTNYKEYIPFSINLINVLNQLKLI